MSANVHNPPILYAQSVFNSFTVPAVCWYRSKQHFLWEATHKFSVGNVVD